MSDHDDIMFWYENCGHEIILSQNNKREEIIGIAICKHSDNTYKTAGKTKEDVLHDLKDMLNGIYHK